MNNKNSGFAEGTPVHTKDGLRPIETIQVGDYVLSKPENGEGEVAYKRVTKTFKHEDRELFGVKYAVDSIPYLITTTAEHPFWVPTQRVEDPEDTYSSVKEPRKQWLTVEEMYQAYDNYYSRKGKYERYFISTVDGKEYPVTASSPLCAATNNLEYNIYGYAGPDFGVLWPNGGSGYEGAMEGITVDFRVNPPKMIENCATGLDKKGRNKDKAGWVEGSVEHYTKGYQPKRGAVYHLAVEDDDTYFVGEHGVLVR